MLDVGMVNLLSIPLRHIFYSQIFLPLQSETPNIKTRYMEYLLFSASKDW